VKIKKEREGRKRGEQRRGRKRKWSEVERKKEN
jgi:hypothetical protein